MVGPISADGMQYPDSSGVDLTVPPAAIWMGGGAPFSRSGAQHVRTLGSSNISRSQPHERGNFWLLCVSNMGGHTVGEAMGRATTLATRKTATRSIMENAKQWAGGALFGMAILGGIILSQHGQEEPIPSYSESQMAGVTVN